MPSYHKAKAKLFAYTDTWLERYSVILTALVLFEPIAEYFRFLHAYGTPFFFFVFMPLMTVWIWVVSATILRKLNRPILWYQCDSLDQVYKSASVRRQVILDSGIKANNRTEFIETPTGYSPLEPRYIENEDILTAQSIRLNWQLESAELLLGERLVDTLIYLHRKESIHGNKDIDVPSVRIEYHHGLAAFPWVAIIETPRIELYKKLLEPLKEYLAISIGFESFSHAELYKGCEAGDEGVMGGMLSTDFDVDAANTQIYGMTCSHVLGPICHSRLYPAEPESPGIPDAALIRADSPCFTLYRAQPRPILPTWLNTLNHAGIEMLRSNRSKVSLCYPSKSRRKGIIKGRTLNLNIEEKPYRFSTILVSLYVYEQYGLWFPIFRRMFCTKGDSGTWVADDRKNWIGMVIGGNRFHRISYVADGHLLLQYFSKKMNSPLLPFHITS